MEPERDQSLRVAAVQFEGTVGRVDVNGARLERMIIEAAENGARMIAVPEFCTSPLPFKPEVHDTVLPPDNALVGMFTRLATRYQCHLGGSMLIADQHTFGRPDIYNRHHLVEPNGQIHTHDKDLPTMWENCFYRGGKHEDDGAFDTELGGVGVASCWELIRNRTVHRLRGRVDVAMTGTHWWTLPDNWGRLVDRMFGPLRQYNRFLSEGAPAEFARRLGAPTGISRMSAGGRTTPAAGVLPPCARKKM